MNNSEFGSPDQAPIDQPAQEPAERMVQVRLPQRRPIVTYTILAVTVLVYLLQELNRMGILTQPLLALTGLVFGQENLAALLANGWGSDLLVLLGGKISPLIMTGQVWRLLTPALLHASLIHIGGNMYALFIVGPRLERFYGPWRFLALYVLGALGGNILSFLLTPGLSVGASTAIFGLFAAEGVLAYQNRRVFGAQARSMVTNTIYLLILNLVIGFTVSAVDNWGHIGGLLAGLAFSWLAGPSLEIIFNYPEYKVVDRRPAPMVWLIAAVLFAFLAGVVISRIFTA